MVSGRRVSIKSAFTLETVGRRGQIYHVLEIVHLREQMSESVSPRGPRANRHVSENNQILRVGPSRSPVRVAPCIRFCQHSSLCIPALSSFNFPQTATSAFYTNAPCARFKACVALAQNGTILWVALRGMITEFGVYMSHCKGQLQF